MKHPLDPKWKKKKEKRKEKKIKKLSGFPLKIRLKQNNSKGLSAMHFG